MSTTSCTYAWVGASQWWCQLTPAGQAAWVQAIGSLLAIAVAIFIPWRQANQERRRRNEDNRKIVMSVAANLEIALNRYLINLDFAPAGDGVIGHDFNLEQAHQFMRLTPDAKEALLSAVKISHYFDSKVCEEIVLFGIEAGAYERILENLVRLTPNLTADTFFQTAQSTKDKLAGRVREIRNHLKAYLPQRN